jgi:dTDP-4-amino-4,6-dideoxygalactose transaminase
MNAGARLRSEMSSSRRTTFLSFQPPAIGEEEVEAVAETLRSGWLTSGPRAEELEHRFAEYAGARHGVALASGTGKLLIYDFFQKNFIIIVKKHIFY